MADELNVPAGGNPLPVSPVLENQDEEKISEMKLLEIQEEETISDTPPKNPSFWKRTTFFV